MILEPGYIPKIQVILHRGGKRVSRVGNAGGGVGARVLCSRRTSVVLPSGCPENQTWRPTVLGYLTS